MGRVVIFPPPGGSGGKGFSCMFVAVVAGIVAVLLFGSGGAVGWLLK